jgi:hypothetical protein
VVLAQPEEWQQFLEKLQLRLSPPQQRRSL